MQAVLRMLEEIGSKENIPKALERAKNKQDPFRLMGFGHRVYKTFDPRALSTFLQTAGHALILHGVFTMGVTCVSLQRLWIGLAVQCPRQCSASLKQQLALS